MLLTDTMLNEIAAAYTAGGNGLGPHYLYYAIQKPDAHIIYGMDGPQRYYLALQRMASQYRPGRMTFREFVKRFLANRARDRKDDSPLVSNYSLDLTTQDIKADDDGPWIERSQGTTNPRELERRAFTDRYASSHFGIEQTGGDADKQLKGAQKNDPSVTDVTTSSWSDYKNDMKGYAVRRACKFLMYDSISLGKTVVYALDDLDLGAVAGKKWLIDKSKQGGGVSFQGDRALAAADSGFKKVPVCTTEIRELFRSWDYFSGANATTGEHRVQFMKGFKAVPPPWLTQNKDVWASYAGYLANKWDNLITDKAAIQRINRLVTIGLYQRAIDTYHGLRLGDLKRGDRMLPVG